MNGRLEDQNKIFRQCEEILAELPRYVQEWYLSLRASDKSATTCRVYINSIKQFLRFIDEDYNVELSDINQVVIMNYMVSIQTKNKDGQELRTSDSYRCGIHAKLSSFIDFLYRNEYIEKDYMKFIEKPKNKDLARINENRVLLTEDDFQLILDTARKGIPNQRNVGIQSLLRCRDISILLLFMFTGIREGALVSMNVEDVDFVNNTISVIDKGEKRRTCYIPEKVSDELQVWLIERKEILDIMKKDTDALFINYSGNRISKVGIYQMVQRYTYHALGKALSPHKLRAGLCSILYNETHDLEFVRRTIGHSDISTTQRYVVTDGMETYKSNLIMNKKINV